MDVNGREGKNTGEEREGRRARNPVSPASRFWFRTHLSSGKSQGDNMNRPLLVIVLGMTLTMPISDLSHAQGTSLPASPEKRQQLPSSTTAAQQVPPPPPQAGPQSVATQPPTPPSTAAATPVQSTNAPRSSESPVSATTGSSSIEFFPWASAPGGFSQNWETGLARFVLGLIGALFTVYLFLGEFLPSMGGKAEYEVKRQELEDQKKRRDAAVKNQERLGEALGSRNNFGTGEVQVIRTRIRASDGLIKEYDHAIDNLEREISAERWRLFLVGFPMYILLGGFFASAFAVNALQALVIGFGWTAVADRIGLQKQLEVKKQATKEEISKIEVASLEEIKQLKESNLKLENQLEAAAALARRATSELAQTGRTSQPQTNVGTPQTPPARATS